MHPRPRTAPQLPYVMRIAMGVGVLFALVSLAILPFAAVNVGSYEINGESVSGPEFLRRAGLAFLFVGISMGVLAYAIWREDPRSRTLVLLIVTVIGMVLLGQALFDPDASFTVGEALGWSVIYGAIAYLYFYVKPNVRAYFDELEGRRREGTD